MAVKVQDILLPILGAVAGAASPGAGIAIGKVADVYGRQREKSEQEAEENQRNAALQATFADLYGDPELQKLAAVDPESAITMARTVRSDRRAQENADRMREKEIGAAKAREWKTFLEGKGMLQEEGQRKALEGAVKLFQMGDVEGGQRLLAESGVGSGALAQDALLRARQQDAAAEPEALSLGQVTSLKNQWGSRGVPGSELDKYITTSGIDVAGLQAAMPEPSVANGGVAGGPSFKQVMAGIKTVKELEDENIEIDEKLDALAKELQEYAAAGRNDPRALDGNASMKRRREMLWAQRKRNDQLIRAAVERGGLASFLADGGGPADMPTGDAGGKLQTEQPQPQQEPMEYNSDEQEFRAGVRSLLAGD